MIKQKRLIGNAIVLALSFTGLSACSTISNAGKSVRNMTSVGQQSSTNTVAVNEQLIIPPSLKTPTTASSRPVAKTTARQTNQKRPTTKRTNTSGKNYYVVVGTYTSQPQAFETFVRLSSIGLPGAAMESRKTKKGQVLHMVRLGPYQKQESIDKVTNSLTSDGLTQFKVVEN